MKGKRYSQEQKIYALKQVEAGAEIVAVCRQLGVSVATFYARHGPEYRGGDASLTHGYRPTQGANETQLPRSEGRARRGSSLEGLASIQAKESREGW